MKLLQRTSLYQLVLAVPLMIAGTAIGYVLITSVVTSEVDEQLAHQAEVVMQEMRNGQRTFSSTAPDMSIAVRPGGDAAITYSDTTMYNAAEEEILPWRIGRFSGTLPDGSPCTITIGRSLVETEEMVMGIALSMVALLTLIVLGNWLLNRWLSRTLWRPFHGTLNELQRFDMNGSTPPVLPDTRVEEFTAMNRVLNTMMAKLQADFTAQKRFTEQAAHELQTPLAVMQGKLDQLIQSPNIGEQEAGIIDGLFRARERMGRNVNNMLLLARIGNQQFAPATIDWQSLFEEQHTLLEDTIQQQGLRFSIQQDQPCTLRLHPLLADVLVANLVRNAVQHSSAQGNVNVKINAASFVVSNTGKDPGMSTTLLFDRFVKADPSSASAGLGLSMVKEIAERNGLHMAYGYADGIHTVVLSGG